MRCFKCGSLLSANNTCPKCGEDVTIYKKTCLASNAYYNLGLEKARVRDLSGAVETLKISLMINKYNTNARNLLGLVYCEMGEVVEALTQWVISKNLTPDDNVASDYIKRIQSNQNRFEMVTGTIKKFNQALVYAKEDNLDLAIIQLKKIIMSNPALLKAQLLLGLLYLKTDEDTKASKCINYVLNVDKNNTIALRYSDELKKRAAQKKDETATSFLPKRKKTIPENKPLNGNDVIIPRSTYKEPSNGGITVINILIGVLIGAALIWFLVVPARNKGMTSDYNKSLADYSEQLSSSSVEINSLQAQVDDLTAQKESLESQLTNVTGTSGSNALLISLINGANAYISGNTTAAAEAIMDIDVSALPTDEAKSLYNTVATATLSNAATSFYNAGRTAYSSRNYEIAANNFVKAYKCDSTNVNYVYYAALSYVGLNDTENAKLYYNLIISDFASSNASYYSEANSYVSSH
ncbi:tetratricopeptide repeat protein [Lachnospira multipara]|jgi:tetratricopeptide (TPR) repeat protein|uniref:tetratricopeptide repeat protein n=1 Tax=Lachnospira multipara TaxID=28051 RepID=UPI0004E0BB9B|nr:hypothetical protein [Lachnospira multipara]